MGEPWLDSLSDDWHASSSSPSSASAPQSQAVSSAVPQSRASRIPRYISPHKSAHLQIEKTTRNPSQKSAHSSENNHDPESNRTQALQLTTQTMNSKPTTLSSVQSVIKLNNPRDNSKDQQAPEHHAPDWKVLALRQQDLFNPVVALEGIFQKPLGEESSSPNRQSFSFYNDLSHMPSSPPPWPIKALTSGQDADTPAHHSSRDSTRVSAKEGDDWLGFQSSPTGSAPRKSQNEASDEDCNETDAPSGLGRATQLSSPSAPPPSSSSGSAGFSPVFISKHNTVDGRVDYAALDPAALPKLGSHVNVGRGGHSDDGSFRHRPLSPSLSSTILPSESLAPSDSVSQTQGQSSAPHFTKQQGSQVVEGNVKDVGDFQTLTDNKQGSEDALSMERAPTGNEEATHDPSTVRSVSAQTVIERQDTPSGFSPGSDSVGSVVHHVSRQRSVDNAPGMQVLAPGNRQTSSSEQASSRQESATTVVTEVGCDGETRRPQSVAGRKRKDARYDSDELGSDASAIASRDILRPRNPTPWHGRGRRGSSASNSPMMQLEKIEDDSSPAPASITIPSTKNNGAVKARALALEAATFGQHQHGRGLNEARKKSVSTQDYLNEAMRIMDMIRARKKATASDWSSNTGHESETGHPFTKDVNESMQSITRPPSREGPPSAWRTRPSPTHVDPRIESQLRKYEETGDESFLVSSIVRSVRITDGQDFYHEQDGVGITDNPHREALRRNSDSMLPAVEQQGSLAATRSSNGDTQGSEETQKTSSTQKASSIGRIAPETVSHLIRDQEGGMRFDTQRQTWVKCKLQRPQSSSTNVPSSSAATEDDPLGEIPDLSVNGKIPLVAPEREEITVVNSNDQMQSESPVHENPVEITGGASSPARDYPVRTTEDIAAENEDDLVGSLPRPKEKPRRRREQSVLFSSPPVSREWDAKHWTDSSDHVADSEVDDTLNPDSSELVPRAGKFQSIFTTPSVLQYRSIMPLPPAQTLFSPSS